MSISRYVTEDLSNAVERPPAWIAATGTLAAVIVIFGTAAISLALPWNEQVRVGLEITSLRTLAGVNPPLAGRIIETPGPGERLVRQGEVLATLGEPADFAAVARAELYANDVESARLGGGRLPAPPADAFGGPVNAAVVELAQAVERERAYETIAPDQERAGEAARQLATLDRRRAEMDARLELAAEATNLVRQRLSAREELLRDGWISPQHLAQTKLELVQSQMVEKTLLDQRRDLEERSQRADAEVAEHRREEKLRTAGDTASLQRAIALLRGEITQWRYARSITAPATGKLRFSRRVTQGELLQPSDQIAVIVAPEPAVTASGLVSMDERAAVEEGQPVELVFRNYPAALYGSVEGRVTHVYRVASGRDYAVRIDLPHGLTTSLGREIPRREGMLAEGRIQVRHGRMIDLVLGTARRTVDR